MNTEAIRAHERLLAKLPVRTHERKPEIPPQPRKPIAHYSGARPVQIGRRRFSSITTACKGYHVHPRKLYEWLASGRAKYLN